MLAIRTVTARAVRAAVRRVGAPAAQAVSSGAHRLVAVVRKPPAPQAPPQPPEAPLRAGPEKAQV